MSESIKITAIIPARYKSTRLPRKLFRFIGEKTILRHVYDNAVSSGLFDDVVIACDEASSSHIDDDCNYIITSDNHHNGTQRIGEVAQNIDSDYVVNIQGDEPFINKQLLKPLVDELRKGREIVTLKHRIDESATLFDYNLVKVVTDAANRALYFSRQAIPAVRDEPYKNWIKKALYYSHVGIYGFKREVLLQLISLPKTALDQVESLEQLNWLYHGYIIYCVETLEASLGIDSEDDLARAINYYENKQSQ